VDSQKEMTTRKYGKYLESDLNEILDQSKEYLEALSGSKILITGGTGFVGSWLATALLFSKKNKYTDLELTISARDDDLLAKKILLQKNDLYQSIYLDFEIVPALRRERFTHLIHSATPSSPATGGTDEALVRKISMNAADYLVELAKRQSIKPVLMHLSSGAVYGKQEIMNSKFSENGLKENSNHLETSYSKVKFDLERIVEKADQTSIVRGSNPRLFAFAGPGIALDAHFAVGNFLHDALSKRVIELKGNPLTERSYLYPTDMVTWLIACLANPTLEPTHIGSDVALSMQEIAGVTSKSTSNVPISYGNSSAPQTSYVPETKITRERYGLKQEVDFAESIKRWAAWLQN
jgi:nucleoside-diphosphate-sugar epimerase